MEDEFAVSGVPMSRRGAGMADYVAALRAVWGPDPVHHEGRFYRIPESEIGPKPAQPGGIPILIGAFAPAAIARGGQFADGHNPLAATWDGLVREVETFRTAAREAGRDPATLPIIARANARLTPTPLPAADRPPFVGTVAQWAADLNRVAELGIDHVSFAIDDTPLTERLAAMAELRQRVP
jgi:alkanesulfonate monooxygenase SsuD/methylene tetrahydromethanopterin reductase-like flavin-dependent oxidoreductase (luciferase family)